MSAIHLTNLDQSEAETLRDQLRLQTANLRCAASIKGHKIEEPKLSGDVFADIEGLSAHKAELERLVSGAVPLPASSATLQQSKGWKQDLARLASGQASVMQLNLEMEIRRLESMRANPKLKAGCTTALAIDSKLQKARAELSRLNAAE
jgi:hypothetical protein